MTRQQIEALYKAIIQRHQSSIGLDLQQITEQVLLEQQLTIAGLIQSVRQCVFGLAEPEVDEFVHVVIFFYYLHDSPDNYLDILHSLLMNPNHFQHGEIIRILQDVGSEKSISYLLEAIALKPALSYLDYDDYGAYYKKCLWALTAIGTEEAKTAISFFTASSVPELREEAIYRLSRFAECSQWAKEYREQG